MGDERKETKYLSDGITPARSASGNRVVTRGPISHLVELRERAIEKSGLTVEELGAGLRKAHETLIEGMSAMRVENHTYQGKVMEQTEHIDHHVRIKAAQEYGVLFGLTPSRTNTPQPIIVNDAPIVVSVNLGGGFDPDYTTIVTTARHVEEETTPCTDLSNQEG
jgi:hypothetical protein